MRRGCRHDAHLSGKAAWRVGPQRPVPQAPSAKAQVRMGVRSAKRMPHGLLTSRPSTFDHQAHYDKHQHAQSADEHVPEEQLLAKH